MKIKSTKGQFEFHIVDGELRYIADGCRVEYDEVVYG